MCCGVACCGAVVLRAVVLWCCNAVVLSCYGVVCCGVVMLWCCGIVMLWCCVLWWCCDVVMLWCCVLWWCCGVVMLWCCVLWCFVLWCGVVMLWCCSAVLSFVLPHALPYHVMLCHISSIAFYVFVEFMKLSGGGMTLMDSYEMEGEPIPKNTCGFCDAEEEEEGVKMKKCSRCGEPYCCKSCQKRDWRDHKRVCDAVVNNELPRD